MITQELSKILQLSVAQRLQVLEEIWNSILEAREPLPLTEQQKQELDKRLEAYSRDPRAGASWHEVKTRILSGSAE